MKKILTVFTAVVLLVCMLSSTLTVSAETQTKVPTKKDNSYVASDTYFEIKDGKIDVTGKFKAGAAPLTTISVDVVWQEMKFHYTQDTKTWNAQEHTYETTPGYWDDEKKSIKVTNHSNAAITAALNFTAQAADTDITGMFYKGSSAVGEYTPSKELATGEGREPTQADSFTFYFAITGGSISQSDTTLGRINIAISVPTTPTNP